MKITLTEFDGLIVIDPTVHSDARGFLQETWKQSTYAAAGLSENMVQDNLSWSSAGVLRGLHLQHPHGQAKLVHVLQGDIFDVTVDVRQNSPTFAKWFGIRLSEGNRRQVFIAPGFAHGFCVLSDSALVAYKCSEEYHPETELTIRWNDPRLAIHWPLESPELSEKDASALCLDEIPRDRLPTWTPNT